MKRNATICALLVLLTLAVFWGVTRCEFTNYDDTVFVTENFHVLGGISAEGTKWAFTTSAPDYWRPLSWLSHQLDVELFGLKPFGHHVTNLLFHIAATVLLFMALRTMTGAPWPSAWVAALFAVHPLHVESVAWVAERKDVLNGFFWMLTLLAYAHYARRPGAARYALVLLAFALGLMSKPMAVTLPCVLLLLDFWPLRRMSMEGRAPRVPDSKDEDSRSSSLQRVSLMRLIAEKVPMLALAIALSALAFSGQQQMDVVASTETLSLSARVGNALVAYATYLRKTFWPNDLAVFYPHPGHWPIARVVVAALVLLVITGVVAMNWRRRPYLIVGWLWFLGTLVPTIGLVQVGAQAMADRYTYVPLIGVFLMLTWFVTEQTAARPQLNKVAMAAGVVALAVCAVLAAMQARHWRTSLTLFQHALAVTTDNSLSRLQLADALMRLGRLPEAEEHLARAVALTPQSEHVRCNYAIALSRQGKVAPALEQLTEALRLKADYAPAHAQMAMLLAGTGKVAAALTHYREALRVKPDFNEAANNFAWLLATTADDKLRDGTEAVRVAEQACIRTRWSIPAYIGTLAAAYAEAGRFPEAVATAERARSVANSLGDAALAARNEQLLALYRTGKPARDSQ